MGAIRKFIPVFVAFLILSLSSFVTLAADEAEAQFRAKHSLEPTTVLKFLDEKRAEISLADFSRRIDEGANFSKMMTKSAKGEETRTFQLLAPLTAEQLAKAKEAQEVRKARMQQLTGKPLSAFKLLDVDGKPVSNKDLPGRPTLINFYFAECLPCILETPMLNAYQAQRKDVRMLAVTFDNKAAIDKYNGKHKFAWQSLVDAKPFIDEIGVQAYPTFLLVDAEGLVKAIATPSEFPGKPSDFKYDSTESKWLNDWVDGALAAK